MKIFIWKYTLTGNFKNYFDRNSSLVYSDRIELRKHLQDSFPVFREEWTQIDNANVLKTGFFDLKLSLNSGEVSVGGKSVLDFFENIKTTVKNYKYLVICETGAQERNYSGFIEPTSFKLDLNYNKGQEYCYFSVTGAETEFVDLLKTTYITKILSDKRFEDQYVPILFYWADPEKILIDSRLDLYSKLGFHLMVDKNIQNNFWDNNLEGTGTYCYITNWDAFRSFLQGFQFRFKLVYAGVRNDPVFRIILYYRGDGISNVEIKKFLRNEIALNFIGTKSVAVFYHRTTDAVNPDITHFKGIIMDKDNVNVTNTFTTIRYSDKLKVYSYNLTTYNPDEMTIIELSLFKMNLNAIGSGDVAYCYCNTTDIMKNLWTYIANYQLNYLIESARQKRILTLKIYPTDNITTGAKAIIEDSQYILERVNSYDNFNNIMETEWEEV